MMKKIYLPLRDGKVLRTWDGLPYISGADDNLIFYNQEYIQDLKIKGQPMDVWREWLENELTPPVKCPEETAYVLEAFLDIIKQLQSL